MSFSYVSVEVNKMVHFLANVGVWQSQSFVIWDFPSP